MLGVSFDVAPGQIVGVAGPNGSGKSTLLKLVGGLCRPQAGAVMLDGVDIRQIDPKELRLAVAYLPQQSRLFHGTIGQNLRIVQPTATEAELHAALEAAGALDDVLALPHGLETRVGDQRSQQLPPSLVQRLAIARTLARQAPILLLDSRRVFSIGSATSAWSRPCAPCAARPPSFLSPTGQVTWRSPTGSSNSAMVGCSGKPLPSSSPDTTTS